MAKNLKDIYVGVVKNDEKRNTNDLYPTPPIATYVLCKYSNVPVNVVEPCAGRGNISVELERNGHNVRNFDVSDYENSHSIICVGQDAMELPKQENFDGLVTNPPYFKDLPRKILEKSVEEYPYVAMFLRLTFLEGIKRNKTFSANPPTQIIVLSDRVRFKDGCIEEPLSRDDQLGGMIAYAWFIWDKSEQNGKTKIDWVLLRDEYDEWHENYERNQL